MYSKLQPSRCIPLISHINVNLNYHSNISIIYITHSAFRIRGLIAIFCRLLSVVIEAFVRIACLRMKHWNFFQKQVIELHRKQEQIVHSRRPFSVEQIDRATLKQRYFRTSFRIKMLSLVFLSKQNRAENGDDCADNNSL